MRERLFGELGLPLPSPRVRLAAALPSRHAVISLFEVPARVLPVPEGPSDAEVVRVVSEATTELLRARAGDFLGLAETQRFLDELEQFAPATVRNVVPKPVSLTLLTDILRRLLEERVSIRDLRGILERVIAFDYAVGDDEGRLLLGDALVLERNTTGEPIERAETFARYIRKTLARVITGRAAPDGEVLPVFLMGWEAEQPLLSHLAHLAGTPGGTPITSAEIESLHDAIRQTIEEVTDVTRLPPIVTNASVAELLRESIAPAFPHMTVLSFEDLTPGVSLSTLKRITPP
jgi:type III secretion protein V